MKKRVELPSGQLSRLVFSGRACSTECDVELEMTARHYDLLTTVSGGQYEDVIMSVLADLMPESDVWTLSYVDMAYIFALVKVTSFGGSYDVTAKCPSVLASVNGQRRLCAAPVKLKVGLSESDVKYYRGGKDPSVGEFAEQLPKLTLDVQGTPVVFSWRLPTMREELSVMSRFDERGIPRSDLTGGDQRLSLEYARLRQALHLVPADGSELPLDMVVAALEGTSFRNTAVMARGVRLLGSFGLETKRYNLKCGECGGTFMYRLPFLGGIIV